MLTLPRRRIIKRRSDFQRVYRSGRSFANRYFVLYVFPSDGVRGRVGFAAGKKLFAGWAAEVTRMGGAVSAEHGVGKIKRGFLKTMYGPAHISEMARLKCQLDSKGQLGRGNLCGEELLDEMVAAEAARANARERGGVGADASPADAEKGSERA